MANKIGRYTIERKLGRGSMAQVYLVWDEVRNESVALKALLPNYVQNPNIRRRFLREAAAIKRLPHRFIIPIYDFGESDGQVYYTMQALDGGTLGDRIEAGNIADETLLFYFERIAEAVDHIHKRGVVHRDIKPNNIIFNRFGRPFLADFGVIQLNKSRTTNVGSSFIGTPAYMSPEQVMSREVDHRADLYTLGIVLFEMLTGNVPFEGDSVMETAQMQVNHAVPKLRDYRQVDKRWQKVIEKALSKDPNKRYQSGAEMATAVHEIVEGQAKKRRQTKPKMVSQPARVPASSDSVVMSVPPREKRPFNLLMLLPIAAVLMLLGAVGAFVMGGKTPTPTPTATAPVTASPVSPTLTEESTVTPAPSDSMCRKENEYDFQLGKPEFVPEVGSDYTDGETPTVRYPVENYGCPLIETLIEFEALERGTPIQAFRFEDGEEQEIDQLNEGSVGYLVLEFAPQTVEYLNDVWQFVIDDGEAVLELSQREKIEIQERWLRLEADEVGQLPIPATNTPRPTATQVVVNVPVPTNTPFGAAETPSPLSVSTSTSVPATQAERATDVPSPTPDWNGTKTVEAAQTHVAQTRQAIDAQNSQEQTVQQTIWATNLTATSQVATATEWAVGTETRQAQIDNYNATQTAEAISPTALPVNTPVPATTVWPTKTTAPRPAPTARPTNTPLPTPTPTPTERPFIVPVIISPDRCVVSADGFVQTPFQWTGQLKAGQSFAIRVAPDRQNPRTAGQYVKNRLTDTDSIGGNGTNWSISNFDMSYDAKNKNYRWTVAVLEGDKVLAFASDIGCLDNTGGAE